MSRFWIAEDDKPWQEVDQATYVQQERQAGFHNTMGQPDEPATASFHGHGLHGSTFPPNTATPA